MKILVTLFCICITNICFASSQYHEFEGVSELYNIRNLRVLAGFLPQDPVIIEAGAYKGRDTAKVAQKFPLAHIYAFEPLMDACADLRVAMIPYSNVTIVNQALDKTSGIKDFFVCHGTHSQYPIFEFHSSLLKPTESAMIHLLGPVEKVSCISLHDFCRDQQIEKIDMLWLSCEGSEMQVLEGAQTLLNTVSLIYARSQLYPNRESITLFDELKSFMEKNGFILLSHFYLMNIHGDALFIRKELMSK